MARSAGTAQILSSPRVAEVVVRVLQEIVRIESAGQMEVDAVAAGQQPLKHRGRSVAGVVLRVNDGPSAGDQLLRALQYAKLHSLGVNLDQLGTRGRCSESIVISGIFTRSLISSAVTRLAALYPSNGTAP